MKRGFRWFGVGLVWLLLAVMTAWATAALYFDFSFGRLPLLTPILYLAVIAAILYVAKTRGGELRHYLHQYGGVQ